MTDLATVTPSLDVDVDVVVGRFPADRLARVGMTPSQIENVRAWWASQDTATRATQARMWLAAPDRDVRLSAATIPPQQVVGSHEKYVNDYIGNRPAPSAFGIGWYFARDDNGGTLYHSDGVGTWDKITLGQNWASGTQLAYSPDAALSFNALTNGITFNDLSAALHVTIPASSVPVRVYGKVWASGKTGTAATGSVLNIQLQLADSAGAMLDIDNLAIIASPVAQMVISDSLYVEATLPAPVASGTYKLMGRVTPAGPAGWANALLESGGGLFPTAWLKAVAE